MSWNEVTGGGKWLPQIGDKLEGVLKSCESRKGQHGDYHVFVIENAEGESFNLSGSVLETKLGDLELGTKVIAYKGEQSGKNGKYKDFAVQSWTDD